MKYNHSLTLTCPSTTTDGRRWAAEVGAMRLIHLDSVRLREQIEPADLVESIRNGFNGNVDSSPRLHQTTLGPYPAMREAEFFLRRHHRTPTTGTGAIQ